MHGFQWFMTTDTSARLVGYEWFPTHVGETDPMAEGELVFRHREKVSYEWCPPIPVGTMPLVMARAIAEREGFPVEVGVGA